MTCRADPAARRVGTRSMEHPSTLSIWLTTRARHIVRYVDTALLWTAIGSAASALSAGIAAIAAYQANSAAHQANSAARTMRDIEQQRYHHELSPKFKITCIADVPMPGFALLQAGLFGGQLDEADSVQITILNFVDIRRVPEGMTRSDAEAPIWAGWQFDTFFTPPLGTIANALSPRQSQPRPYSRTTGKDFELLRLRETVPPRWSKFARDEWREYWRSAPLRLLLTCRRGNHDPWYVYENVWVEHSGASRPAKSDASGGDLGL